jgi:hypothetical protein
MIGLKPGDIFATRNTGFMGWLASKLMAPKTDRFHYGLIVWQVPDEDDYIILESIGKGIAVGRLSFYKDADIKFYRADCPEDACRLAPIALTRYGRSKYDYLLILKIMLQGFWLLFKNFLTKGRIRPIYPWELSWCRDDKFVCTEAVDEAYDLAGCSIIPDEFAPVPAAYKYAELSGELFELVETKPEIPIATEEIALSQTPKDNKGEMRNALVWVIVALIAAWLASVLILMVAYSGSC